MAKQNLEFPGIVEPPPRVKVTGRLVGPMLSALRRQAGYQFVVETDRHGETCAWLVRSMMRMT